MPKRAKRAARTAPRPVPTTQPAAVTEAVPTPPGGASVVVPTPLNGNLVATSASLLGLTVHEMPASVNIVTQQQMREQGYRTTTETAIGAVGVLVGRFGRRTRDLFDARLQGQRGDRPLQWNLDRPGDITSRIMDTANLARSNS